MTLFDISSISQDLPAAVLASDLPGALPKNIVIQAPPGTGKTTIVPPLVANRLSATAENKVIVATPRRVAARAAPSRLAQPSHTAVGDISGFSVRGERKVSDSTRVEFATYGLLLRRLLSNPELPGVTAIILDEIHERSLDADVVLAMLRGLRTHRTELTIIAMSATLDTSLLDGEVFRVESPIFPLETHWAPAASRALYERGVSRQFLTHVAEQVKHWAPLIDGDALVFLPGAREIDAVASQLREFSPHILIGSMRGSEQDAVLQPSVTKRVILATNIAESALTVPGVRLVIDAGLDRQQRVDTTRLTTGLVTVGASKSSMTQRAGRAGREGPGTVVRCMSEAEFAARSAHAPAEIRTSDVTEALLELRAWPFEAHLPEPFPERTYEIALDRLQRLGALDSEGTITDLGRRLAHMPVDPSLGRALLDGAELVEHAPEAVAVLNADARDTNAWDLYRSIRTHRDFHREVTRFRQLTGNHSQAAPQLTLDELGIVTALAYPHQIARRRHEDSDEYLTTGGTAAVLPKNSSLTGTEWLAISELGLSGQRLMIRRAVDIDQDTAELAWPATDTETARFIEGKVSARRRHHIGAITLSSTPIQPTEALAGRAVAEAIAEHGLSVAKPSDSFNELLARVNFAHQHLTDWPSETELINTIDDWAGYELAKLTRGQRPDLTTALKTRLGWQRIPELDRDVPETLRLASGNNVRVHYEDGLAVVAVKLQQCFGMSTPVIAGVPVQMQLLSPAGRPLAITQDLVNFWAEVYPQVRAENRGRYPKHPWPEHPTADDASARTKRR